MGERTVLLGIIEGDATLQVITRTGQLSEEGEVLPQRPVGRQKQRRVVGALSKAEKLMSDLARRPHLRR